MIERLDETDLQILKTLQKNAKLTTKELADAVHMPSAPVFGHLRDERSQTDSRFQHLSQKFW